ncbi:MAG: hypothetical protein Q8L49_05245 [Burkholderiaceae bacterium]|nr:hypothetical protein [Burkholderiaceae bacterium]
MTMTRRHLLAATVALAGTGGSAAPPATAAAVPLSAPAAMARLHGGQDGALLGVSTAGELWQATARGWQRLGSGLDPAAPLASGHGRIVGRSTAGGLWVLEAGRVQTLRSPTLAPHAGLLVLALGIIAVAVDAAGLHRVVRLDPAGSSWAESARSAAVVLPDARPLQFDPDASNSDEDGHVAVFAAPSATRYRHGVLGDAVEPTALLWLERHGLEPLARLDLPPPHVFEDIAPRAIAWRGRRGLLTVRSGPSGGQLAVIAHAEGGRLELAALGEPIGTPNRWMSPSADGRRLWAVHTPHIGGVLHRYADAGDRLSSQVIARGVSNHAVGERELDVSAWVGSRWVVPAQDRQRLLLIDADAASEAKAPAAVTLAGAVKALSPWRRGPDDGVAALLQDGSVWWVAVAA